MTDIQARLRELNAIYQRATPGLWTRCNALDIHGNGVPLFEAGDPRKWLEETNEFDQNTGTASDNLNLVCALQNEWPTIRDEIARLIEEVGRLEKAGVAAIEMLERGRISMRDSYAELIKRQAKINKADALAEAVQGYLRAEAHGEDWEKEGAADALDAALTAWKVGQREVKDDV